MNKYEIIGNLTADPVESFTANKKNVTSFTVAVNRRPDMNGERQTEFVRVSAWGKLGESCKKYLAKGRKVFVCGEPSVDLFTDRNGNSRASLEIRFANEVEFLSSRSDSPSESQVAASAAINEPMQFTQVMNDDDLPF